MAFFTEGKEEVTGFGGLSRFRQPSEKLHNDEVVTRVDLEFLG
jgi:hypothetical protein